MFKVNNKDTRTKMIPLYTIIRSDYNQSMKMVNKKCRSVSEMAKIKRKGKNIVCISEIHLL